MRELWGMPRARPRRIERHKCWSAGYRDATKKKKSTKKNKSHVAVLLYYLRVPGCPVPGPDRIYLFGLSVLNIGPARGNAQVQ